MTKTAKFAFIMSAIEKGLEEIKKWHKSILDNPTYFICLDA